MRIGVIGHFGGDERFLDGQTIKTITLFDALQRLDIPGITVDKADTYYLRHNWLVFIRQMFLCILRDKKIIVLLSSNGRKMMFPVLYMLCRMMKKEVYHYAIGGRLADEIQKRPLWKKYLSAFQANWMESERLAASLKNMGLENAGYMPNFKAIDPVDVNALQASHSEPFRFCMFSRVMEDKGILDGIKAIGQVNRMLKKEVVTLDIYGAVEEGFREKLDSALALSGEQCRYCGVVDPKKSVDTLKAYYMLLFPTHFRHEGMPGTIIDALAAGVPVIARDWQYCREILEDGDTGFIYDFDRPEKLTDKIMYAVLHSGIVMDMKYKCVERAKDYCESVVIHRIAKSMGLEAEEMGRHES